MLTNDQIREKVGKPYSDELIDLLREWYAPYPGRPPTDKLIIENLSPSSGKVALFQIINSYVNIKGKSFMEVGFGSGVTMACAGEFGARKITGIEIKPDLFRMAFLRCHDVGITPILLEGDVYNYNFNQTYDVISCWQVLEHIEQWKQKDVIKKLYRMLKTGGVLFIQIPNKSCFIDTHDSLLPFAHWLPPEIGKRYTKLFGRTEPTCNCMRYRNVVSIIMSLDGSEILNSVDICRNLKEFLDYRFNRKDLRSKFIAALAFAVYCLTLGNLQHFLPNVNLFVRKNW